MTAHFINTGGLQCHVTVKPANMLRRFLIFAIFCCNYRGFVLCQYVLPEVKLEAFEPSGLKATIPDDPQIKQFAFHAKINTPITNVEPGDYYQDINQKQDDQWSYFNPNVTLKVGDVVYYWIFVQHGRLGYRNDVARWTVDELKTQGRCKTTNTVIKGRNVCPGDLVFEENFDGNSIDEENWLIEHYIPNQGPDYEFNSYQNSKDVCYVKDGFLFIRPKIETNVRGTLDLTQGCTANSEQECNVTSIYYQILPPVKSAKMHSKFTFKYGIIEIKAKLPAGNWIYPQLHLMNQDANNYKIMIAYARGNEKLTGNSKEDLGSTLLFGGPVETPQEPTRSTFLKSIRSNNPYTDTEHRFKLTWLPNKMTFHVDDNQYGTLDAVIEKPLVVTLGVGVGGINDFPDDFTSGTGQKKPWKNAEVKQVKKFYESRSAWSSTWKGENVALKVDYVKVWAV